MNDVRIAHRTKNSLAFAADIELAVLKLTLRQVEVQNVEAIGERFRVVTLAGESLRGRSWTPGDMLQIAFPGWQSRAYTPFAFVPEHATAQFLGYVHGNGVGSAWLAAAHVGESRFVLGPRGAVNLSVLQRPLVLFGDETSFSTAAALRATPTGLSGVRLVFEVSSLEQSRAALERLGLATISTLIQREAEDAHLEAAFAAVHAAFASSATTRCVLTGAAPSIKRMYKALRRFGVPSKQVSNCAYWAPGRNGFSGVQR